MSRPPLVLISCLLVLLVGFSGWTAFRILRYAANPPAGEPLSGITEGRDAIGLGTGRRAGRRSPTGGVLPEGGAPEWPGYSTLEPEELLSPEILPGARRLVCRFSYEIGRAYAADLPVVFKTLLPPNVPGRQAVVGIELDPEPSAIYSGPDGVYAVYRWNRGCEDVRILQRVEVEVIRDDAEGAPRGGRQLEESERRRWLEPEPFVECDDPTLIAAAEALPGKTPHDIVRSVMEQVVETLQPVERNLGDVGALRTLRSGRAYCVGYNELAVALLRARGVPARLVEGLVTGPREAHHHWTEAWLPTRGWVSFDPWAVDQGLASLDEIPGNRVVLSRLRKDPALGGFHVYYLSGEGDRNLDWERLVSSYDVDSM